MTSGVAADVGGTFTDIVAVDDDGRLIALKVPSTPRAFGDAVVEGVGLATKRAGNAPGEVERIVHGTTVATNAVLERSGPRTGLITTAGFRDVLEIGRLRTPTLYDLSWSKPSPIVGRRDRLEVDERIAFDGAVIRPVDLDGLVEAVDAAVSDGVSSFAVSLINAYANPEHEVTVAEWLRHRHPLVDVTEATSVVREVGEFERTSTGVLNAYLRPVVATYLDHLETGLERAGFDQPLLVMQSNGGMLTAAEAGRHPASLLESGPAAGVLAAAHVAVEAGEQAVVSFDMGGTTAKASLIEDSKPARALELSVGSEISSAARLLRGGGIAVRLPVIDLAEVGAGGGSIARIDVGGALVVGPRSAGAEPGPACYARGGTEATVTDANLVLGYVSPDHLRAGGIDVDRELAVKAIGDHIAEPLGLDVIEAAFAVHAVADRQMARALRSVTTERGRDITQHTLIAFGGSGPLHAASLAEAVRVTRVIVPPLAGVLSALGLLQAPVELSTVETVDLALEEASASAIAQLFQAADDRLRSRLVDAGIDPDAMSAQVHADVRYVGQASELTVATDVDFDGASVARLDAAFRLAHDATYGHGGLGPLEVVRVRIDVSVKQSTMSIRARPVPGVSSSFERLVHFDGTSMKAPVVSRDSITAPVPGPVLVDETDTTTVVPPGWTVAVDSSANLILERAS